MQDTLTDLPGYLLRRAAASITAELSARIACLDLRIAELSVLMLIESNANVTQSALCRALDIQRANMAPIAARLSERGLIERQQVDGRSQSLALTDAGKTLAVQARIIISEFENSLVARVPAQHKDHIIPVLDALWSR